MRNPNGYHGDRSVADMLADQRKRFDKQLYELKHEYDEFYSIQTAGRWARHTVLTWIAASLCGYILSMAVAWRWPIVAEHWHRIWN
jgi:hypothetical protein